MMSIASCPDCEKVVSLQATTCPNCGRPFKEGDLTPIQPKPMNPGCIILAAIIVILMIVMAVKVSNDKQEDQRIRERILDTERRRSGG